MNLNLPFLLPIALFITLIIVGILLKRGVDFWKNHSSYWLVSSCFIVWVILMTYLLGLTLPPAQLAILVFAILVGFQRYFILKKKESNHKPGRKTK